MGKVLIKCIQTPMQKYFYDRSLDSVVMVNDEEYQILKTVEKTKLVPDVAEGKKTHHGGPCIPAVRRLFVDTKGEFFHVKEFRKKIQKCASEVWIRDLILIK